MSRRVYIYLPDESVVCLRRPIGFYRKLEALPIEEQLETTAVANPPQVDGGFWELDKDGEHHRRPQ